MALRVEIPLCRTRGRTVPLGMRTLAGGVFEGAGCAADSGAGADAGAGAAGGVAAGCAGGGSFAGICCGAGCCGGAAGSGPASCANKGPASQSPSTNAAARCRRFDQPRIKFLPNCLWKGCPRGTQRCPYYKPFEASPPSFHGSGGGQCTTKTPRNPARVAGGYTQ